MSVARTLLASGILLLAGGAVLATATDHFRAFTSEEALRIKVRQRRPPVPAVTLETQSRVHINLADLRGKWVLVDFMYTRCMTYCSVLGGEFAQIQDQLAAPLAQGKVQLLSISFDPEYDAPPQLASYLERFHSHGAGWLATRPADIDGLTQLERVFGITVIPDGLGGYVHSAGIDVVDPQGRLVEVVDINNSQQAGQIVLRDLKQ